MRSTDTALSYIYYSGSISRINKKGLHRPIPDNSLLLVRRAGWCMWDIVGKDNIGQIVFDCGRVTVT